ncbi:MAG: sigma-70 family RNA polymerase sigma factor [Nannocystaceae bacterium]|nr:sigma-70 family RNA polymerase sigma factor [Nannocystaceae bacterium]
MELTITEALVEGFLRERRETLDPQTQAALLASLQHVPCELAATDATAFGGELARCLDDRESKELAQALAELHVSDLWLAFAARTARGTAVTDFERACIDPLGPTIGRVDSSAVFVDEVRQRVRAKLLVAEPGQTPRLERYRGRGELATWVRVVAAREALTVARSERRRGIVDSDDLLALEASTTGPELGAVKEQYRAAFGVAFRAGIASLTAEQRNVLRLHYLHGLTVDDLAGLLSLHRSNAARRVAKARAELLSATRLRLQIELRIDRAEFEALIQLIASRIDVSIERHLGD